MWGAMNAQGLTELHVLPQKQIVNTTYYIHEIRKKIYFYRSAVHPARAPFCRGKWYQTCLHAGRGAGTHVERDSIAVQNEFASFLGEADVTGQLPPT